MERPEAEALIKAGGKIQDTLREVDAAEEAVAALEQILGSGKSAHPVLIPIDGGTIRILVPIDQFKSLVVSAKEAAEADLANLTVDAAVAAAKE